MSPLREDDNHFSEELKNRHDVWVYYIILYLYNYQIINMEFIIILHVYHLYRYRSDNY